MKLTDLFWRDRNRADRPAELAAPARRAYDPADRSSMAELVRLLKEADDSQKTSGQQPA
jgi:hypothetical protein